MKIYLVGGVNGYLKPDDDGYDEFGWGKSYFVRQIIDEISACDPSKVAIVTAAKEIEDKHKFDTIMTDSGVDMTQAHVLNYGDKPTWSEYEAVILTGGNTQRLYDYLKDTGFALDRLSSCKVLVGESAGSYVLCAGAIVEYDRDGSTPVVVLPGFNPDSKLITAAHVNNPHYHREGFGKQIEEYCREHDLKYLPLKENEIYEL